MRDGNSLRITLAGPLSVSGCQYTSVFAVGDQAPIGGGVGERLGVLASERQQAARDVNNATLMVQLSDGAAGQIIHLYQCMRELAVQGATETYSTDDLGLMDTEYQQLESEIQRIVISRSVLK